MAYKVLFIDDDEFIQKIYKDRFEASGIEIVTAGTVSQGEGLFDNGGFDLVCTDYILPDKTGEDFIKWIREEKKSDIPVVVFSASGQEAKMKEIMDAGATDYVQKDHTVPTELVEKIKSIIDAHRK